MARENVRLFRVFTDSKGDFGDLASVVIDERRHISDDKRQEMAHELNTGETAFINDIDTGSISIMHPQGEIDFAGTVALASSWLLTKLAGKPAGQMHGRGGAIATWQDDDLTWVRASLATMPPWNYKQLGSPEAVERIILKETETLEHTMMWAWLDETKGLIRARTFATDWDIPEAQGNGSGSMVLAAKLGRAIEIKHGEGSIIFAKPAPGDCADIGGRVVQASIGSTIVADLGRKM